MTNFIQLHLWETETSTVEETITNHQTSQLTVNIPAPLKDRFKTTCSNKDTNMTEVVNQLIKEWLKD